MPRDDEPGPVYIEHGHRERDSFSRGFNRTLGCIVAFALIFVVLPIVICAGCISMVKVSQDSVAETKAAADQREERRQAVEKKVLLEIEEKKRRDEMAAKAAAERLAVQTAEGVTVNIIDAEVRPVKLNRDGQAIETSVDFLVVTIGISVANDRTYAYRTAGLDNADAAIIRDSKGRTIRPVTKLDNPVRPVGLTMTAEVKPGHPATDVLMFWLPEKDAGELTLELPILDKPGSVAKVRVPVGAGKK